MKGREKNSLAMDRGTLAQDDTLARPQVNQLIGGQRNKALKRKAHEAKLGEHMASTTLKRPHSLSKAITPGEEVAVKLSGSRIYRGVGAEAGSLEGEVSPRGVAVKKKVVKSRKSGKATDIHQTLQTPTKNPSPTNSPANSSLPLSHPNSEIISSKVNLANVDSPLKSPTHSGIITRPSPKFTPHLASPESLLNEESRNILFQMTQSLIQNAFDELKNNNSSEVKSARHRDITARTCIDNNDMALPHLVKNLSPGNPVNRQFDRYQPDLRSPTPLLFSRTVHTREQASQSPVNKRLSSKTTQEYPQNPSYRNGACFIPWKGKILEPSFNQVRKFGGCLDQIMKHVGARDPTPQEASYRQIRIVFMGRLLTPTPNELLQARGDLHTIMRMFPNRISHVNDKSARRWSLRP